METSERPTVVRDAYPAPFVTVVNAFSDATLAPMLQQLLDAGIIVPTQVITGGGRNGVRWPVVNCYRGNPDISKVAANNQINLSAQVGGQRAVDEVAAYATLHGLRVPTKPNQVVVTLSHLMWRLTHRLADGSFPKVPVVAEVSHKAEAYSLVNQPHWNKAKVELSELESSAVNESRKLCTQFGLMWLKAGSGQLISADERDTYCGPTMCPHASLGSPCYAPYPAQYARPTGLTPNPRKGAGGGRKKGRDDDSPQGGDAQKKAKKQKGGKHGSTQQRLSFVKV